MTDPDTTASPEPIGWAVLELMGHRRLGGYVSEVEIAGKGFLRIGIPDNRPDSLHAEQFYSPGAVYAITPTTEEAARLVAAHNRPAPLHRWELPRPEAVYDDDLAARRARTDDDDEQEGFAP